MAGYQLLSQSYHGQQDIPRPFYSFGKFKVSKRLLAVFGAIATLVLIYSVRLSFPTSILASDTSKTDESTSPITPPVAKIPSPTPEIVKPSPPPAEITSSFSSSTPITPSTSISSSISTPTSTPDIQNVAAIFDSRPLEIFIPLLLHFSGVLGPSWPIIVFTPQTTIPRISAFEEALLSKRIEIRPLPEGTKFKGLDSVSSFFTKTWLWEQLAPAGHVLVFQTDSIICSNSPMSINDFLKYDLVGAPITPGLLPYEGFNGGFSLRNRTLMLDIIHASSWEEEMLMYPELDEPPPYVRFEDQWFYHKMKLMGPEKARLPTMEEANRFSVESVWYERPVGFHQIQNWNMPHIEEIERYCPEYRLTTMRNADWA